MLLIRNVVPRVYNVTQIWSVKLLLATAYYLLITSFTDMLWYDSYQMIQFIFLEKNYTSMTWLIITQYLCNKWPQKCCVSCNHNLSPSHSRVRLSLDGTGSVYASGAHEFTPGVWWSSFFSIFSFLCNVLWIIVLLLDIVLFVLRFTAFD